MEITKLSQSLNSLSPKVCTKFWVLEGKVIPNFNFPQFYEHNQELFLTMVELDMEEWLFH